MNEIIEKLRIKTPETQSKKVPEPITARVSRESATRKKPVSPPPLHFRSPLITKFHPNSTKNSNLASSPTASSLELASSRIRLGLSSSIPIFPNISNQNRVLLTKTGNDLLVNSDLEELKSLKLHSEKVLQSTKHCQSYRGFEKVASYELVQEVYEAITLFKDLEMLKKLLKRLPKDYRMHRNGFTAAHYVSDLGNLRMLEEVNRLRYNLDMQSKAGLTPCMLAAAKGHLNVVFYLWKSGCSLYARDYLYGWNCLHHAVSNNQYETVVFLVKEGGMKIGTKDFKGLDALDLAYNKNFLIIYKFLENFIQNSASWLL